MDPALFRNIALETNDQGQAGVDLALAARRIVNRFGEVVFNPDTLVNLIPLLPVARPLVGDELIQISQVAAPGRAPALNHVKLTQLSQWIGGQFALRFQSTGAAANRQEDRILLETVGATHGTPYLVQFNQIILESFTGPGEFYLDERDASDVPGGESTVTVATKDGFSAGYTPDIIKAITNDKIYRIAFTPGTTGDGIYVINVSALQQGNPPTGDMEVGYTPGRLPPIHPPRQ